MTTHSKSGRIKTFKAKGKKGLNNKAKVTTKKGYVFNSFEVVKLALYHTLGDLPEPVVTHGFCG